MNMTTFKYALELEFNTSPALHSVPRDLDQLMDDVKRALKEIQYTASLKSAIIDNHDPIYPTVSAHIMVEGAVPEDMFDSEGIKLEIYHTVDKIEGINREPIIMRVN